MSLAVTNPASSPNNSEIDQNVVNQGGPTVVPGQAYNFSFYAWQASAGVSLVQNYRISWLNSSGGTISSVGWLSFTGGAGAWKYIASTNLVAPANTVNALITIYGTTGAVAGGYGNVLIDDLSLAYAIAGQTNVLAATVQPEIQLSWPSNGGELYDVQTSGNLANTNWTSLASSLIGTGTTNTVYDLMGTNSGRYYQVIGHP
jgi:hypothetical protein